MTVFRSYVSGLYWLLLLILAGPARAQRTTLRSNLAYDATLTPNIGVEVKTDSVWTVGLLAGLNAWDINSKTNKKWRHLLLSPNVRRYHGEVSDSTGLHRSRYWQGDLIYSHFNVGNTRIPFGLYSGVKDRRLQGDLVALGTRYGWQWMLSQQWALEAEAGLAVGYAWFKEYDCVVCGDYRGRGHRAFLLPQVGVNIVYVIK